VILPGERVPFPVTPVFRVRPDLRRWPRDDRGHLRLDARYPSYLEAKLALLSSDPAGCRVPAPDVRPAELRGVLLRVADGLSEDAAAAVPPQRGAAPGPVAPRPVAVTAQEVRFPLLGLALRRDDLALASLAGPELLPPRLVARVLARLEGLPPVERLADALALAVQEDLVIMQSGADDAGRAELLQVCFPSGWDPAARAGADFAALHAPVPHGEILRRAAPPLVRAMVARGPFVRYVWSLAPDGRLDRNPRRVPASPAVPPAALWFRVERQTVMPMPELRRALFTIRVYVTPLAAVLGSRERRTRLAAAVASMDEATLVYKGIGSTRAELLRWLGAAPAAG